MNHITGMLAGGANMNKNERIISLAIGVALMALGIIGMKRRSKQAWVEIAAGASMLLRGASGYCPVTALIDRNTTVKETAEVMENIVSN
jgi:uncharacterized membrane protein